MARQGKDRGGRRHVRVNLRKPGFVIPAPDAPWIECTIVDVSEEGVSLDVGSLSVPKLFGLAFTAAGEVLRVCSLIWRNGEMIGAEFLTAKELRAEAASPTDAAKKKVTAAAKASAAPGSSGWISPAVSRERR